MALAHDASSVRTPTSGTSASWSHTCTGSDRVLFVTIESYRASDGGYTPTSVTYNGVSMTKIVDTLYGNGDKERITVWGLIAPATGSNTISVSFSANQAEIVATADSYTGADQTTAWSATPKTDTTDNTTSYSVTVTDGATGDLVYGGIANFNGGTPTWGAGQTQRANHNGDAGGDSSVYCAEEAGASSVTFSLTWAANEYGGFFAFTVFASGAASQNVTGTSAYAPSPVFPTGGVNPQGVTVSGSSAFAPAPVFPTGGVNPQAVTVSGSTAFAPSPVFPTGEVSIVTTVSGASAFAPAPVFPTGSVDPGAVTVTGSSAFAPSPVFPTGSAAVSDLVSGSAAFAPSPVFPTGALSVGSVTITGSSAFVVTPVFPTGSVGDTVAATVWPAETTLGDDGATTVQAGSGAAATLATSGAGSTMVDSGSQTEM